jgi:site-specific recombinase XerD
VDEWRLFWVGKGGIPNAPSHEPLRRWTDLDERERALGFRDLQPILVSPDGRIDPRLSRFFRRSKFSTRAHGTQETYAPDYRVFFTFLWRRGLGWDQATAEDLADWEDWRRRGAGNPAPVGGARWGRELAALRLLYDWAVASGHMPSSPIRTVIVRAPGGESIAVAELSPKDARSANVKWLTPGAFRTWRSVGLSGMTPTGLEDASFRGRNGVRDAAFADLLYSSGLRRREAATLLSAELPQAGASNYYAARVGQAVAKRSGRYFYVGHGAVQAVHGYRAGEREQAVRRARSAGRYAPLPGILVVEEISRRGLVRWTAPGGRAQQGTLDTLTWRQRLRLFVRTEDGLEPAMLWLTEAGMPMDYKSWTKVFERASDRCARLGLSVWATPHMLRHSMALRMLVSLNNALDRRLGLSAQERRHYEEIYGNVWAMVKDLLGHSNEQITRDVYLEPVRGLQLESLLNDEHNPVNDQVLAELGEKTGLILTAS